MHTEYLTTRSCKIQFICSERDGHRVQKRNDLLISSDKLSFWKQGWKTTLQAKVFHVYSEPDGIYASMWNGFKLPLYKQQQLKSTVGYFHITLHFQNAATDSVCLTDDQAQQIGRKLLLEGIGSDNLFLANEQNWEYMSQVKGMPLLPTT